MEEYRIALLRGDGIGPEIVDAAVRVLEAVGGRCRRRFRNRRWTVCSRRNRNPVS